MKAIAGWTIECFNGYNAQNQKVDTITVAVYADTQEEALGKAKTYIGTRSDYRVVAVIESIDPYDLQQASVKGMRNWPNGPKQ